MLSISHWGMFDGPAQYLRPSRGKPVRLIESFDGEFVSDTELYGDRFRNRLNFKDGVETVYQRLSFGPFLS